MEKTFQSAWLPLSPRGVAAFARARLTRLWLVQFTVALLAAGLISWFVNAAWFSVVTQALQQFPEQGQIRFAHLQWPDESPRLLAEGHFLAFSVDGKKTGDVRSPAHVQIEFNDDGFSVHSLLGYREGKYPTGWVFEFNRRQLEPKWGAWRPMLVAGIFGVVLAGLMLNWTVLATIYFFPVWTIGFFLNRELNFRASWRLAGAALMPGALFLTAAISIYALGWLDLVQLGAAFGLHFLIGWVYLWVAPMFLPKISPVSSGKKNPFASQKKS